RRLLTSSNELRNRSNHLRERSAEEVARSERLIDRSREQTRRFTLSRAIHRHDTTSPAIVPPSLICPQCDQPLLYSRSHLGGVSASKTSTTPTICASSGTCPLRRPSG